MDSVLVAINDVEAEAAGVHGHEAVVLFLALGKIGVGEEVGMLLDGIVELGTIGPAFVHVDSRPN